MQGSQGANLTYVHPRQFFMGAKLFSRPPKMRNKVILKNCFGCVKMHGGFKNVIVPIKLLVSHLLLILKSEYDQEIPQTQTADPPTARQS